MPELVQQLRPIDLDALQPPLAITLVVDAAGIAKLREELKKVDRGVVRQRVWVHGGKY